MTLDFREQKPSRRPGSANREGFDERATAETIKELKNVEVKKV